MMDCGSRRRQGSCGRYLDTTTGAGPPRPRRARRQPPRNRSDAPQPPSRPPPSAARGRRRGGARMAQRAEGAGLGSAWTPGRLRRRLPPRGSQQPRRRRTRLGGVKEVAAAGQGGVVGALHAGLGDAAPVVPVVAPGLVGAWGVSRERWSRVIRRASRLSTGLVAALAFFYKILPAQLPPAAHHAVTPAPQPHAQRRADRGAAVAQLQRSLRHWWRACQAAGGWQRWRRQRRQRL